MTEKKWLMGTLVQQGILKTKSGDILLTPLPEDTARRPEPGELPVEAEKVGKTVLVAGELVGEVLYSAEIIETLPHLTGALIHKLDEKGILSHSEIQEHLHELEGGSQEPAEPQKIVALVIGHKKSSPGAVNQRTGLNEFNFNDDLAITIEKKVLQTAIQRVYRRTYKELPGDINALNPDFVLSLHCNAYNGRASGTEVLYYHQSEIGKRIAEILQKHLVEFLGLRDRGIKEKTSEDRGGFLLRYTRSPCVIAEPFFIDNDDDLAAAQNDIDSFANIYAIAIDKISSEVI
jgi:N-acetylmuramoyl-L-alanine amidase